MAAPGSIAALLGLDFSRENALAEKLEQQLQQAQAKLSEEMAALEMEVARRSCEEQPLQQAQAKLLEEMAAQEMEAAAAAGAGEVDVEEVTPKKGTYNNAQGSSQKIRKHSQDAIASVKKGRTLNNAKVAIPQAMAMQAKHVAYLDMREVRFAAKYKYR